MKKAPPAPRRGRPPGTGEHESLFHVRIPMRLRDRLERIRKARADAPSTSALVREAIAQYVEAQEAS